jgi:hypothetical protein
MRMLMQEFRQIKMTSKSEETKEGHLHAGIPAAPAANPDGSSF